MLIATVGDKLVMRHPGFAPQQKGHLDRGGPLSSTITLGFMTVAGGWFILALVCLLSFTGSGVAQRNAPVASPRNKVGLVTREFTPARPRNWRGVEMGRLHVTIWYPAAESSIETAQTLGTSGMAAKPLFEAGSAAPHASFAPTLEPFPLILLSHGTGGSAAQMAWLGTALARSGFIAAAVDHPGNNAQTGYTPAGFLLWWERATDLSDTLDGLLTDAEIGPHIDRGRVGAAGFSLGGYTAMEMAGARTDISNFYDLCRAQPANAVCVVPEMKSLLEGGAGHTITLEQLLASVRKSNGESLALSGESFRDPRIKAVFAIAPALGFTLTPESLRAIRLPVMVVVGSADSIAPPASGADILRANVRGAKETVLPGVEHDTFLDLCTAAGRAAFPQYCRDPAGVDRAAVHAQTAELAVQFFARVFRLK